MTNQIIRTNIFKFFKNPFLTLPGQPVPNPVQNFGLLENDLSTARMTKPRVNGALTTSMRWNQRKNGIALIFEGSYPGKLQIFAYSIRTDAGFPVSLLSRVHRSQNFMNYLWY